MGTSTFHKASQSFYTQNQVTSNPSCPILNSLPDTVWPTVDVFGCQSVSSQRIQKSLGSLFPVATASSELNIMYPGFRWMHPHPTLLFMYHTPIFKRCKRFFTVGNALLRKTRMGTWMGGCEKKSNTKQCSCNTQSSQEHAISSKVSHSAVWTGWSKIKEKKVHSPSSCAVVQFFPWSRDLGTRCDWLLDSHAAFKAKSSEKRTHSLHYSWGTEDEGHSSASFPYIQEICIQRQLPSTSF